MKFGQYIKGRRFSLLCMLLALALINGLLVALRLSMVGILFIDVIAAVCLLTAVLTDFIRRKRFYDKALFHLEALDKKYLLHEMLSPPQFAEGELLCGVLYECSKAMADEVLVYKNRSKDYREYIEAWVHEIKTPIACAALICENHKTPATKSLQEEIAKIENFVEQALYYARSNYVEKDYSVLPCNLRDLVSNALKLHAKQLIENKTVIEMRQLNHTVYTDDKWVQFMLGQILLNAMKYQSPKRPLHLTFTTRKKAQQISLLINDNGSGIVPQDLGRVFEQGFTGENGRKFAKSTGMGLFICKKLCDKLGLSISLNSVLGEGTTVSITFPVGNLHTLQE